VPGEKIVAYLSHSYRHDDRKVNEFFWKLFWENGVTFAVDPESEQLSIPYLELMMKRSSAFVGIVTRRPEERIYQSSPFMVFEHGLAVQAQKPRLLFVESGVPKYFFPDGLQTMYFSRQALPSIRAEAGRRIGRLAAGSDVQTMALGHGLGKVGLLNSAKDYCWEVSRDVIRNLGFTPVDLNVGISDAFRFALELEELDFIILDIGYTDLPSWLYPFLSGRFIPTIKVCRASASPGEQLTEPPWETGELLRRVAAPGDLIVRYKSPRDLRSGLARHVERLREERILLSSLGDGHRYFRSLGRKRGRIFISTTSAVNYFSRQLSLALHRENIPHFHYRYQNDIELATLWNDELPERIRASQYFLPLVTGSYWKSQFCQEEYRLARERAEKGEMGIVPYFLESSNSTEIPEQGRDLSGMPVRRQIRQIVEDMDRKLTADEGQ
jgi:hypothetical protein